MPSRTRAVVMADGRLKEGVPGGDDRAPGSTLRTSAEAKRLSARRRFLIGGAAAIPIIVTANRAKAVGVSTCLSQFGLDDDDDCPMQVSTGALLAPN